MKHLKAVNAKASRMEAQAVVKTPASTGVEGQEQQDVFALQSGPADPAKQPHVPVGCSLAFFPGWEVDSAGGTAGLCQPSERDLYDCYADCFWPAQVPDHLNRYPDWSKKCAAATQDWRNLDVVFP